MKIIRLGAIPAAAAAILLGSLASAQSRVDAAFEKFWAASSSGEAERIADEVSNSGVTFDDALRLLKAGRTYKAQAAGVVQLTSHSNDIDHHYAVNVPANYDPTRRYQVRFQLHGGIGRRVTNEPQGSGEI